METLGWNMKINDAKGVGQLLHSKEGVTQGDPLAMIICRIVILPSIREIKADHSVVL